MGNPSLYAQYLLERTNDQILETESGFLTYRFLDDKSVYIIDVFVIPEKRRSKEAAALADTVIRQAKLRGCTEVLGTVSPAAKTSTESIKVLLGWGMSLRSSSNDLLVFKKDI